jgi:hypothetical protein
MQIFLNNFSRCLLSSFFINPELRILLEVVMVHVTAAAITATVLGKFPGVGESLAEATVAVASAIELNL